MQYPADIASAELFADELQVNSSLSCDFTSLLSLSATLSREERNILIGSFLRDRGFETDIANVKIALERGVDPEFLPDADAIRFAVDLYSDPVLLRQWLHEIESAAQAETPVGIETFLRDRGYQTHPKAAAGALAAMTTNDLIQWAGTYRDTQFTNGNKTVKGYRLEITKGSAGTVVSLDNRDLIGSLFDPATNTLSWLRTAGNACDGRVSFSRIDFAATAGAYIGPVFSGTADLYSTVNGISGHVNFSGRFLQKSKPAPATIVAAVIGAVVSSIAAIVGLYKFVKWVGYTPDRWRRLKTFFTGRSEADDFLVRSLERFKGPDGEINGLLEDLFVREKRRILAEELLEYHRMSESERAAERGRDLFDTISKRVDSVREDEERVRERRLEMQEIR